MLKCGQTRALRTPLACPSQFATAFCKDPKVNSRSAVFSSRGRTSGTVSWLAQGSCDHFRASQRRSQRRRLFIFEQERLDGTNEQEGRRLLAEANLPNVYTESTMDGAAAKVVALANK